ncbi:MAG TPA: nitroreductase family protein [Armatimonadota bacterium]|nr:nitroreductase family protein [Armatimonadota bacterium]
MKKMDIREALQTRRSVRVYEDRPVPREILEDILECARWSPSARNIQPWSFVVVTHQVMRERIAEMTTSGKHIARAPVCIAVLCEDSRYYVEDGSSATNAIMLAAWAHGLGTCWIAGDKKPYAMEIARLLGAP